MTRGLPPSFLKRLNASIFFKRISQYNWKTILIVLFILFLPLSSKGNISVSDLSSASAPNATFVSQRQFDLITFSLAAFVLFPLAILLIKQFNKGTPKLTFGPIEISLLLFFILSELSVLTSTNVSASFVWLLKLLYGLIVYFIFSHLLVNKRQMGIIISTFAVTFFFEVALAIIQFLKGGLIGIPIIESLDKIDVKNILVLVDGVSYFRAVGTFSHPNLLSAYIDFLLPIFVSLLFIRTQKKISFLICITSLIILLLTLSRWGIITALFSSLLTITLSVRLSKFPLKKKLFAKNRRFSEISLILLTTIFLLLVVNPSFRNRFLNFSLEEKSLSTRVELMRQALYVIEDNPFGIGGGAFSPFLANYDYTQTEVSQRYLAPVHNFYLLTLSEMGFLGFLGILIIVGIVIKQFLLKIINLSFEDKQIAIGLFASFITFFFSGIWEPRLFGDRIGILFFLELGLLINILNSEKS